MSSTSGNALNVVIILTSIRPQTHPTLNNMGQSTGVWPKESFLIGCLSIETMLSSVKTEEACGEHFNSAGHSFHNLQGSAL